VPTQSVQRGGDTSRRLVAGTMYICNQPKTETALNVAFLTPPHAIYGPGRACDMHCGHITRDTSSNERSPPAKERVPDTINPPTPCDDPHGKL
jgi:hypothetical protein